MNLVRRRTLGFRTQLRGYDGFRLEIEHYEQPKEAAGFLSAASLGLFRKADLRIKGVHLICHFTLLHFMEDAHHIVQVPQ